MLKQLVALLTIQVAFLHFASASQVTDFFRQEFKNVDVIYLGELHTVAEHKVLLADLLETLVRDGTIDVFAFEFTRANKQTVFEMYLGDTAATPGSEREFSYFKEMHWAYGDMFNVKEYDAIFRLMKRLAAEKQQKVAFCAIDAGYINEDTDANGPKFQQLSRLPVAIQSELRKITGMSIEQLGRNEWAYDRETAIGFNVAECAKRGKKTLAFVGFNHAIRTERIMPENGWRTSSRYTELALPGKTVKSALIAQGYFDPYDNSIRQFSMFDSQCLKLDVVRDFTAFRAESVADNFAPCLAIQSSENDPTVSLASTFDYIIAAPRGSKVKPNTGRQWR